MSYSAVLKANTDKLPADLNTNKSLGNLNSNHCVLQTDLTSEDHLIHQLTSTVMIAIMSKVHLLISTVMVIIMFMIYVMTSLVRSMLLTRVTH